MTGISNDVNIVSVNGLTVTSPDDFRISDAELHAALDSYVNKADWKESDQMTSAELHSALDSYVNKDDWKASDQMIASELHAGLDSYTNKDDWRGSDTTDLQPALDAIDALNDVTAVEVRAAFDAEEFKAVNTEAELHVWLDSYLNKDSWKATDVVVDTTPIDAKLDSIKLDTDGIPALQVTADSILSKDAFDGTDRATLGSLSNYTTIHADLDSYTGKDAWKATDVVADLTETNAKIDAVKVDTVSTKVTVEALVNYDDSVTQTKLDDLAAAGGEFTAGDRSQLFTLHNYTALHADMDSYANKDDYKADIAGAVYEANVTAVNGVTVASVEDFKAAETDLGPLTSKVDVIGIKTDNIIVTVDLLENYDDTGINTKLDTINSKDAFNSTDRSTLGALDNYTSLHTELDSYNGKDAWKADVSGLSTDVNIVAVAGSAVTSVDDFKATTTDIDAEAIVAELLNTDIHAYNAPYTVGEVLHRIDYIAAKIYVDTDADVNGHGSQRMPFDNVNDAKDYAEENGIRDIIVSGNITVPGNLKNMTIWGVGLPTIDFNGQDVKNTRISECVLTGAYSSSIIAERCVLTNGFELDGFFDRCALNGEAIARANTTTTLVDCLSNIAGTGRPSINMNSGVSTNVGIRSWRGGLDITHCDHIDDVITVQVADGAFRFTDTCTNGVMVARGTCKFVDESNGAVVHDETSYKTNISETVWRESTRSLTDTVAADIISVNSVATTSIDDFNQGGDTSELVALIGDVPTAEENADALLGRVI